MSNIEHFDFHKTITTNNIYDKNINDRHTLSAASGVYRIVLGQWKISK